MENLQRGGRKSLQLLRGKNIVTVGKVVERTKVRQISCVHYEVEVLVLSSKCIEIKVSVEIQTV